MNVATVTRHGKKFALVPIEAYRRYLAETRTNLPDYPPLDAHGTRNALESIRVLIARRLIQDRTSAGLTQQQLAELAGVRQETISRIESGKHTATMRIVNKLDKAIGNALRTA